MEILLNAAVQNFIKLYCFMIVKMGTEIHILWIILELLALSLSGHTQQHQKQQTLHSHSVSVTQRVGMKT